jgi:hypothetical protein
MMNPKLCEPENAALVITKSHDRASPGDISSCREMIQFELLEWSHEICIDYLDLASSKSKTLAIDPSALAGYGISGFALAKN